MVCERNLVLQAGKRWDLALDFYWCRSEARAGACPAGGAWPGSPAVVFDVMVIHAAQVVRVFLCNRPRPRLHKTFVAALRLGRGLCAVCALSVGACMGGG